MRYAQLNDENVVISISQLSGEEVDENLILINELDVLLGSTYNRETGEFTPPESQNGPEQPAEPVQPIETIEEKLARMERQIEEQSIVQLEVLATIYEELLMKG